MSNEYKQKSDIPDLYKILGLTVDVCKDPECDRIIEKAYLKKAKLCDPGRHPGRKDVEELFKLLSDTYDVLKDEKQRSAYNHKLSLKKQCSNDFLKLKKHTTEYVQTIGDYVKPSKPQELSFDSQMSDIDSKHGYDRTKESYIESSQALQMTNDRRSNRTKEDINFKPENLFDGMSFDIGKFNAAFDQVHHRTDDSIMLHNGVPSAWNDLGSTANFSSFDTLDKIYVDEGDRFDTSRQIYGSVDFAEPVTKITKDNIKNIKPADYVRNHNTIDESYYSDMKSELRNRSSDASIFNKMSYGDFKKDDTAGYGIFDQLGLTFENMLELDKENSVSEKFERLMKERQTNPTNDK